MATNSFSLSTTYPATLNDYYNFRSLTGLQALYRKKKKKLKTRNNKSPKAISRAHEFYIIIKFYRGCEKNAFFERELRQFINGILRNSLRELRDVPDTTSYETRERAQITIVI